MIFMRLLYKVAERPQQRLARMSELWNFSAQPSPDPPMQNNVFFWQCLFFQMWQKRCWSNFCL